MKQNLANAKTQERWGNLPPQFADAAGYQTPEQRAGAAQGTLAQGTADTGADPNMAEATGGLNGNPNQPDSVKETTETQMNADGSPNETKRTQVETMDSLIGSGDSGNAAQGNAATANPGGRNANAGGGNAALPGGGNAGGGNAALPANAGGAGGGNAAAGGAGNAPQVNAGANQQAGANAAQQALVGQAQAQANTRGGIGTGVLSNVATLGLSGALRGAWNANQRQQGQNRLRQMAGGNFTASFDEPLDNYWAIQKHREIFRDMNSTEAIRYALR
jgi:hypothetical protein